MRPRLLLFIAGIVVLVLIASSVFILVNRSREQYQKEQTQQAFELVTEGKYREAVEILRKLNLKEPASFGVDDSRMRAEMAAALGNSYLAERRFSDAIKALEEARALYPDIDVANELAMAYAFNGNLDKALQVINAAIQESPDNLRLYVTRALVYEKMGDMEAAGKDVLRVRQIDPNYYLLRK